MKEGALRTPASLPVPNWMLPAVMKSKEGISGPPPPPPPPGSAIFAAVLAARVLIFYKTFIY